MEGIKENSHALRGTIGEELRKDSDHFGEQDKQLLKFHGTYQQEDRDARKARRGEGLGKHYMFMVRCKIPGGRVTAEQYLALDKLADAYGNGTLRFTSRQGIQFHGVLKSHLKDTIAGINACLLTTLGACGDVERNVMCCPAPLHHDGVRAEMQATARRLALHLAPRSGAYHEIWLNGQPVTAPRASIRATREPPPGEEPIYGKVYLPRKFKTGLALPEDNCIDVYGQDLGLLAIVENHTIAGYNLLVGGGMGMTHGNANTFPMLAQPICYVPAGDIIEAAEAVVKLFRDHGNRADRKRARIKYVVHDWGVEKFRDVLAGYLGGMPAQPRPVTISGYPSASRLASAGRRQVVLRTERREWPGQGRGIAASALRSAGHRRTLPAGAATDRHARRVAVQPRRQRLAGPRTAFSTSMASSGPSTSARCVNTAWRARRSRRAAWPSPKRSALCPASSMSWKRCSSISVWSARRSASA